MLSLLFRHRGDLRPGRTRHDIQSGESMDTPLCLSVTKERDFSRSAMAISSSDWTSVAEPNTTRRMQNGWSPVRFAVVTTADASCVVTDDLSQLAGFGAGHIARTFRARRTGQLTGASVVLELNSGGNAIAFGLWAVDQT